MGNIFTVFSIFYAFRGIQIAWIAVQNWAELRGPTFTPENKSLAGQASFFLAVPIGVFIHELGHALAVWLFGGQVLEFGYRVFWGYVRHTGVSLPEQLWFTSLAGTIGSLVFGLFCWLALRNHSSPTFRYFGVRAFHYQIFFSLVYYPVFTLMGFYGDWRTIYDFNATPILSGATAVLHAGLLILFWQGNRSGFFEMAAFSSEGMTHKMSQLEAEAAVNTHNPQLQLDLIDAYRRGGKINQARQHAQKFVKENPRSPDGYLQLAMVEAAGKAETPRKASDHAAQAISLGLNNSHSVAIAHLIIGQYHLGINQAQQTIDHLTQAIAAAKDTNEELVPNLLYIRALAYRRQRQYESAYRDIERAIQVAEANNKSEADIAYLQQEMDIIQQHAGRSFGGP